MSTASDKHRKALGKGLSALLPGKATLPAAEPVPSAPQPHPKAAPTVVPVDKIHPNPLQPRSVFQPAQMEELAQSIRANGIIQPLIVRRHADHYQIVAGERRWRAAQIAGLSDVPVVIQDVDDNRMLELALIENIQREDLNPIEAAHAFDRLSREMGLSQEEIGRRTGKDRSTIANFLRLLRLPAEVQVLLAEHRLSMGQARAILSLPTPELQIQVAEKTAAQGLSVRQVEALVRQLIEAPPPKAGKREVPQDPNVRAAAEELERVLGTRVRIVELTDQRGRIEIEYYSQEDLDRVFNLIVGTNAAR